MDKDYSTRTSEFYDDRDGDTVTSLNKLIKVCEPGSGPKTIHVLEIAKKSTGVAADGVPEVEIDVNIVRYVKIDSLPKDIRDTVLAIVSGFSKDS